MCDKNQVLVIQDTDRLENSRNILSLVQGMYEADSYHVTLLALESEIDSVCGYFHRIVTIPDTVYETMNIAGICEVVEYLQRQHHYSSILIPATRVGRMLAPRIARRLHTGLVADVTDVKKTEHALVMLRTAYAGNIMAGIRSVGEGPVMMSVHPDSFSYELEPQVHTTIHPYEKSIASHSSLTLLQKRAKPVTGDIRNSDVLISGGGGMKRHFPLVQQLAETLGGAAAASRKLVDHGVASRSIQVGQSGKLVRSRLYFALGINGAIQHVEGLKGVETIIAVNTSAKAPICSIADIVVEGDAKEFIEKLLARIQNTQDTQIGES